MITRNQKPEARSQNGLILASGFWLLAFLCESAAAQTFVIRGARLIDGVSDQMVRDGVVVVEGSRIVGVGSASAVAAPAEATLIDLGDVTILPGLIDTHTHILLQGDITQEDYDRQ